VLNRIPFFAAHYEGHAATAHLERPHEAEPQDAEAARDDIPFASRVRGGNGNGANEG